MRQYVAYAKWIDGSSKGQGQTLKTHILFQINRTNHYIQIVFYLTV